MEIRWRVPAALLLLATLVASCGSSDKTKTPEGVRASCAVDADCVVTDGSHSCCAACREAPHAIPKLVYEQDERRCAKLDCSAPSERIECPKVDPPSGYVAMCKAGSCAAVKH